MSATLYCGDVREVLARLPDASVRCCVTSPPYWGLRDYGVAGQLGLEATPEEYVARMVEVFRAVRRVLTDDGTVFLNLGDSYWGGGRGAGGSLKPKDLVGIPWRVAFALQAPYYTGRIARLEDRIWLAAMIEAEGCIHIHRRPAGQKAYSNYDRADGSTAEYVRTQDTFGVMVSVDNVYGSLVDRCHAIFAGLGSRYVHEAGTGKQCRKQSLYRWTVTGRQARELIREVYPHLIAKRQQARIAFHSPSSGETARASQEAIKALHKGHQPVLDAPELPTLFEPGFYLRSDIIWGKSNPMPESITDRPTKAHEYVFLLSKCERYYYDAGAIAEEAIHAGRTVRTNGNGGMDVGYDGHRTRDGFRRGVTVGATRNSRTVWTIATQPYPAAHFATFPEELAERCILAGSAKGDTVLDPFGGSGTTAAVAVGHGRDAIYIDLKPAYVELARERIGPMLCTDAA